MVKASKLVYDFTRQFNYIATTHNAKLSVIDKCAYLNDALKIYFENRVPIAETNQTVRNDLRVYELKNIELKKKKVPYKDQVVAVLPHDFYSFLRKDVIASKENCGSKKLTVHTFQSDDLSNGLKHPFWKPSFEWEETICDESSEGLHIWHNGDFKIDKIICDYYRRPVEIHAPSLTSNKEYIDWNGEKQTKDTGLEIDSTFASRKIVDIAVLLANADTGNIRDFQSQIQKILSIEKLHV